MGRFGPKKRRRTMTDTAGGGRAEIESRLIKKSLQDDSFRQELLSDPKAALEQELGRRLPEDVQVRALEETADTVYLVLPSTSAVGESSELSDQDLEAVAGAWGFSTGFPSDMLHPECC
jgi:hypothetical protein